LHERFETVLNEGLGAFQLVLMADGFTDLVLLELELEVREESPQLLGFKLLNGPEGIKLGVAYVLEEEDEAELLKFMLVDRHGFIVFLPILSPSGYVR